MKLYTYQSNPITVVAKCDKDCTKIGVAKFGKNPGESFNPTLGEEIAKNRLEVQPYSVINRRLTKSQFEILAEAIEDHVMRAKQWHPRLPRESHG